MTRARVTSACGLDLARVNDTSSSRSDGDNVNTRNGRPLAICFPLSPKGSIRRGE
jgi:hypothetical protein